MCAKFVENGRPYANLVKTYDVIYVLSAWRRYPNTNYAILSFVAFDVDHLRNELEYIHRYFVNCAFFVCIASNW